MVELPIDVSLLWFSLLLSILFIIAFIVKCSYLPTLNKKHMLRNRQKQAIQVELFLVPLRYWIYLPFRKIPTVETKTSTDEDCFCLSPYTVN